MRYLAPPLVAALLLAATVLGARAQDSSWASEAVARTPIVDAAVTPVVESVDHNWAE